MTKKDLTPDELAELEATTLANIVAKITAGGVPTAREAEMLRRAAGDGDGEDVAAPGPAAPAAQARSVDGADVDILAALREENPQKRAIDLRVYADALATYREASRAIAASGAIVMHPRNGTPIENPYVKVRANAAATLAKMKHVRSERTLAALELWAERARAAARRAEIAAARRRKKKAP